MALFRKKLHPSEAVIITSLERNWDWVKKWNEVSAPGFCFNGGVGHEDRL